jgi:hypothetical protein
MNYVRSFLKSRSLAENFLFIGVLTSLAVVGILAIFP